VTSAGAIWWGHATATIDLGGERILTDPFLRSHLGPLRRVGPVPPSTAATETTLVLVSHLHHDHLDVPSLRRLDAPVVVPRGAGDVVRRAGARDVREVVAGDEVELGGVRVVAVPAHHPAGRLGYRGRAQPVGYLVADDRHTVYFAGDTGPDPRLAELPRRVDLALLPVGGWGLTLGDEHLGPRSAAALARILEPRLVLPIHWGTLQVPLLRHLRPQLGRLAGPRFAAELAQVAPATRAAVVEPGGRVRLA
jgi:L-ascorbate metabolism protein UlaG (beta-lactamase superfamily)